MKIVFFYIAEIFCGTTNITNGESLNKINKNVQIKYINIYQNHFRQASDFIHIGHSKFSCKFSESYLFKVERYLLNKKKCVPLSNMFPYVQILFNLRNLILVLWQIHNYHNYDTVARSTMCCGGAYCILIQKIEHNNYNVLSF